jgi:hypothetical protein
MSAGRPAFPAKQRGLERNSSLMGAALVHGMVSVGGLVERADHWVLYRAWEVGRGPQRTEDTRRRPGGARRLICESQIRQCTACPACPVPADARQ